jgi:hypothetical protein
MDDPLGGCAEFSAKDEIAVTLDTPCRYGCQYPAVDATAKAPTCLDKTRGTT